MDQAPRWIGIAPILWPILHEGIHCYCFWICSPAVELWQLLGQVRSKQVHFQGPHFLSYSLNYPLVQHPVTTIPN